jgi:hypothetical protein
MSLGRYNERSRESITILNADAKAALRALDTAIELNPNLAVAWGYSGLVHAYCRR